LPGNLKRRKSGQKKVNLLDVKQEQFLCAEHITLSGAKH